MKSYFANFQPNSIRKPNNLKISDEATISLGPSCILQIEPTWAPRRC